MLASVQSGELAISMYPDVVIKLHFVLLALTSNVFGAK